MGTEDAGDPREAPVGTNQRGGLGGWRGRAWNSPDSTTSTKYPSSLAGRRAASAGVLSATNTRIQGCPCQLPVATPVTPGIAIISLAWSLRTASIGRVGVSG